jgi:hypothetical protein
MPTAPCRRRGRVTKGGPFGRLAAEPGAKRLHPAVTSSGEEHGDPELAAAERTGPSGLGRENRCGIPSQPAGRGPAGWRLVRAERPGIWIGNQRPAPGAGSLGQERAGVFCKLVSRVWA